MKILGEKFQRGFGKLYRELRLPMIAIAHVPAPDGARAATAFSMQGLSADQLEASAVTLLTLVEQDAAQGELGCACCADRARRARAALAAMGEKPAEPIERVH